MHLTHVNLNNRWNESNKYISEAANDLGDVSVDHSRSGDLSFSIDGGTVVISSVRDPHHINRVSVVAYELADVLKDTDIPVPVDGCRTLSLRDTVVATRALLYRLNNADYIDEISFIPANDGSVNVEFDVKGSVYTHNVTVPENELKRKS